MYRWVAVQIFQSWKVSAMLCRHSKVGAALWIGGYERNVGLLLICGCQFFATCMAVAVKLLNLVEIVPTFEVSTFSAI